MTQQKVVKPAVIKPPIIPFVKPVLTSYQKFPYGGIGYGGGHAVYGGQISICSLTDK